MKELKKARMGIIALILIGIMLLMIPGNVSAEIDPDKLPSPVSKEVSQRQVIIGFEGGVGVDSLQARRVQQELIKTYGGKEVGRNTKLNYVLVEVDKGKKVREFIREITTTKGGGVRYAEPDHIVTILLTPNDPLYASQWGPSTIKADRAWDAQQGSSGIKIAIVDTGIDYNHEDLGNYVSGGYDWVNEDSDPTDDHGHGTHCAGIATAVSDNNIGIAGIAQVSVMAEKVLNSAGRGYTSDVADGIMHAADEGADVISLSLGSSSSSQTMGDACQYAWDAGCIIVAAAGNSNSSIIYPAAYDTVIAVGALNWNSERCDSVDWRPGRGSCYGPELELMAPGNDIRSTVPSFDNATGYEEKSGTSMAAPHVAGVAALVWSNCSAFTNADVREHLNYTADDLGDPGLDQYYGWGRVDAEEAIGCEPLIPDIAVDPDSFDPEIVVEGVREYPLTIRNNGTGILTIALCDTVDDTIGVFSDAMESGVGGWTHEGAGDEWELGMPTSGPGGAYSGVNCWGTDLNGEYNSNSDQYLISGAIDLSGASSATLSFYRWYDIESGYDYGYIEISTSGDSGPWTELAKYTGESTTWTLEEIDISEYTGIGLDNVRIRFRLTSDHSNHKSGLYIDDVAIKVGDWLSVSPTEYPVYAGASTNITVACDTLGHSPGTYNGTIVVMSNDPDPAESCVNITVNMTILPGGIPDISVYPQSFDLNIGQGLVTDMNLAIGNDGDGVLWLYTITDNSDWLSESPTGGRVYVDDSNNITLTFDTTELALGDYTTTIVITNNDSDENPKNVSVELTVIPPDIRADPTSLDIEIPKDVMAVETLKIKDDGQGVLDFDITDTTTITFLDDDMESGASGWTHGGVGDEWELGTPLYGPVGAYSGDNCWGTDLDSTYENYADAWLMSPALDLSGVTSPTTLSFYRWYAIEDIFDHGYVEVSKSGAAGPWTKLATYTDCKETWVHEKIDITGYTGSSDVRIRFGVNSDHTGNLAGMYIDDVAVEWGGWLSAEPTSGSVYYGENTSIDVTIAPLGSGSHSAMILIANNDPDENPTSVPVNVTVEPAEIWVDPTVGFDVVLNTSGTWDSTFKIGNNGPGLLWYGPLSEGFEDGVMPPAGWKRVITSAPTWTVSTDPKYVHSGGYSAVCEWGYDPFSPQDEWLISRPLNMSDWGNATLTFWWESSYTWMVDPYNNFDLLVKVSSDGGRNWETVWNCDETCVFSDWVWYEAVIDLSAYQGNSSVLIAWNYIGDDGHDFVIDDIVVHTSPNQGCSWLDVIPETGVIAAGCNDSITVNIDPTGIPSGAHRGDIVIDHNDPGRGPVVVPVNLTVHVPCGCVAEDGTIFPCGSTVTGSCTFNCDMNCSARHGLIIGADGIIIDGAGHRITGERDGYNVGIYNQNGQDDVVIRDLEIAGFSTGIRVSNADNNTINNCTVHDNGNVVMHDPATTHGIDLCPYVCNSSITDCRVYNNTGMPTGGCGTGGTGIRMMQYSGYNNVSGNAVYDNAVAGIYSKQSCTYNNVSRNMVMGNGVNKGSFTGGIRLQCKHTGYWTIEHNRVTGTNGPGIYVGGSENLIRNNTVSSNTGNGIDISRDDGSFDNELYGNTVCNNGDIDISTFGTGSNTTGDGNTCDTAKDYDDTGATGCTYSCGGSAGTCGDVDGLPGVTTNDGRQIFMYLLHGADEYPLADTRAADCDGLCDGITTNDGRQIFMYLLHGPDAYPLNCSC
ncbi:MAG: S8 family serine peptidase [Euryarchaeota archaeon]|nr:S8 family serine peptidase [Euryarchaeota archaeon]